MEKKSTGLTVEELVTENYAALYRFALFKLRDAHEAEDAVQELFLKLATSRVDFGKVADKRNYLIRCMFNACTDRQKRRCAFAPLTENIADDSPQPLVDSERQHEAERIGRLLDKLPDEQAEVIRMRCCDGLHFTEIADILGLPATTVKSRFAYGIEKLRQRFNG